MLAIIAAMNRREFILKTSAVAVLGALGVRNLHAQTAAADMGTFVPLRGGAGHYLGRGGTIGWLVNTDGIAAVDTQFPEWANKFLGGLPGREARNVDLLINSHHHGDHTGGNPAFRPATTSIVAHTNVPPLQKAAALRGDAARGTNTEAAQIYADTTFESSWKRSLGGETITAKYFGPAHTGGDVIVHVERANVIHMGDLVFNRLYPVTDRPGGCAIAKWIGALEKAVATYPADAIYIFGHGSEKFGVTGAPTDILGFRDYLSALLEHVEKQIAAGNSRGEIVALENLPGFDDFHTPAPNRVGGNLGVAYDELTATG
jgi:glyoxylase-like metal-dependent hydrolase (beta-lactamase superfamily II)